MLRLVKYRFAGIHLFKYKVTISEVKCKNIISLNDTGFRYRFLHPVNMEYLLRTHDGKLGENLQLTLEEYDTMCKLMKYTESVLWREKKTDEFVYGMKE